MVMDSNNQSYCQLYKCHVDKKKKIVGVHVDCGRQYRYAKQNHISSVPTINFKNPTLSTRNLGLALIFKRKILNKHLSPTTLIFDIL